jgi:hypothetical protein
VTPDSDDALQRRQPVLPALAPGIRAQDMFEEEEAPARTQHPADFGEHLRHVTDAAHRQAGDDGIETGVGEWQLLAGARHRLHRDRACRKPRRRAPVHAL